MSLRNTETQVPSLNKTRHKWTPENLVTAAHECQSRGEFKNRFPSAYNTAIDRGVLNEVCAHMTSPYVSWTEDALIEEANRFTSRAEFRVGSPNAYAAAIRRRLMGKLSPHFQRPDTGIGNHLVYRLAFKTCTYIGLTCTAETRQHYHLVRGGVAEYMKESGESLPEMEVIADHLSPEEASFREIVEIDRARAAGVNVLNKAGGGQLGAFGRSTWTKERVEAEALKYSTRTQFKLGSSTAFSHARENGWLDEVCAHMPTIRKTYSDANLMRIAKQFASRGAFQRFSAAAYNACRARGLLDTACDHMRPARIRRRTSEN